MSKMRENFPIVPPPGESESPSPGPSGDDRLDSWKEIAAYLNRTVRTAQRWEKTRGLPVSRVPGGSQSVVSALKSEIDAWYRSLDRPESVIETTSPILNEGPAPVGRYVHGAPEALDHIVRKTLAKDPRRRHESMRVLQNDLEQLVEDSGRPRSIDRLQSRNRWAWLALIFLLSVAVLGVYWTDIFPFDSELTTSSQLTQAAEGEGEIESVAILPLFNVGGDETVEYLCSGIPESVSAHLSRFPGLRVLPSSAMERYRGSEINPQEAARELGVRAVMTGTLLLQEGRLTVRVELVDGIANALIWGQRYLRDLTDIFEIEEDLARQVSAALRLELTRKVSAQVAKGETTNPAAYQAFLKGRYYASRFLIEPLQAKQRAIHHYEQAVAIDPNYQEAYDRLGWEYLRLARNFTASPDDYARARESWERLIEADESTALAHQARARILWQWDRAWNVADSEYRKASEVDPSMEAEAGFLEWMGRTEDYLALVEREAQRADPLSAIQKDWLGWRFLWGREYARAIEHAEEALELEPQASEPYDIISLAYAAQGREQEAIDAVDEQQRKLGNGTASLRLVQPTESDRLGWDGLMRQALKRQLSDPARSPVKIANTYASLGEKEKAFEWLEKAWALPLWGYENSPACPSYDSLRADPRFVELLRQLNLPEEAIQGHLAYRR